MPRRHALLVTLLATAALAPAAGAATIPVTTTTDAIAQDGKCSLREAFFAARFDAPIDGTLNQAGGCPAGSGADVLTLGAGTFELLPGAAGSEDGNLSGDLDTGPASAVRVVGQGPGVTVIDPLLGDRAFDVFTGSSLGLEGLTIRRGRAPISSDGGAVRNQGALTVIRSSFEGNQGGAGSDSEPVNVSGGSGGAIWSGNTATAVLVADSSFTGNAGGAGTVVSSGGVVTLRTGRERLGDRHRGRHGGDLRQHLRRQPCGGRWSARRRVVRRERWERRPGSAGPGQCDGDQQHLQ